MFGLGGAWIACRVEVVGALSLCLSAEVPLVGLCTVPYINLCFTRSTRFTFTCFFNVSRGRSFFI